MVIFDLFYPFLTLNPPKYIKISILATRSDIQKYSPPPCGHFAYPISHARRKKNWSIFSLFCHLWRPPQPKIRIFTTARDFQKWSAHRALQPCTFRFFAKLNFFFTFCHCSWFKRTLKIWKKFLKSPKKAGIRPRARRIQKTPRISNEKNYLNSCDQKCPQK